jgi:hypothetical protein
MKITATIYRNLALILLTLFVTTNNVLESTAAVPGYRFSVGSSTAADMTGSTNLWVGVNQTRFHAASGVLNIGFTFQFDGVNYTQLQVYTTGVISLGSPTLVRYPFNDLTNPSVPVIAPFWDSLAMTGTQGGCFAPKIRYKVFGSAPNRMFVVEWFDQETIWGLGSRGTFQARLYETSGKIEFYYQSMNHCATCGPQNGNCSSTSASIGLASGTNNFISVTPNSATATTSTSTANNAVDLFNVNTRISANVMYTFSPNIQLGVQEIFDFGRVSAGVTSTKCVVVRNIGTAGQLTFSPASISAGEFGIASSPSAGVLPNDSALYCLSITASSAGPFTSTLTINSNGLDSGVQQVQINATAVRPAIEIVPLGTENTATQLFRNSRTRLQDSTEQCFLVKNNGPGQLLISPSTFIDGDYPGYYRISMLPDSPIDSGQTDSICIVFAPQLEGSTFAALHIISNASNGTQDMQLRGTGVRPCIVVTPNLISFDSVVIGDTVCKLITIQNPCTDTLYLNAITLSSDPDFTMNPLLKRDSIIPPGATGQLTVCFRPLARGVRQGRLVFFTNIPATFEDPSRDTSIYYVDLGGTGVPIGRLYADIEGLGVTDSTLIGKQICRQDSIFNLGEGDFLITKAMIIGADSADYTLSGITVPYNLKAKSFIIVTICARPSERGLSLAQLYIAGHTDGIGDTLIANLSVKGLLACAEHTPAELFMLDTVFSSMTDTAFVTVTNCGDVPTTYSATITGPDAGEYTVLEPSIGVVPPNGTAMFTVVFHPSTKGTKSATLRITAPDVTTMIIPLGGFSGCAVPTAFTTVQAPRTATDLTNPITFWVVITNTGNIDWNVGTPVVTPNTVFDFVPAGSATVIPAGGTDSIKISFHPNDSTMFTARITFPGSGPCAESELKIDLVGEGFHSSVRDVRTAEGYMLEQSRPNPVATGMATFNYTVPTVSNVRIVLADVTGKTVRELVNDHVAPGTYEVKVATDGLPSGTYLYIMEAGQARLVRQIVVTK